MLLAAFAGVAQTRDAVYVNNTDSVFLSNADTAAVFGNMEHNGFWGTTTGSYLYFLGQTWKNTPASRFPLMNATANDGGIFCISPPVNSVYSQIIQGGFNHNSISQGPIFPNLVISNPHNIYLDSTDVAVYNTVKMDTGLVYMSANAGGLDNTENSFVLGGGTLKPRVINYNRNKYFVSGVLPQNTSYFYIRNISSSDTAVFPIGSKAGDFTPAGVTSTSGDFMARVFDGVYEKANAGAIVTDPNYLQKTWHVVTPLTTTASYTPILQHNLGGEETPTFTANRNISYISMYDATNGMWGNGLATTPPYTKASIFPNIGNDGDSVFYHWRIIANILNANQGTYFTKRTSITKKKLGIDKTALPVNPLRDGTFDIDYDFVVTNADNFIDSNIIVVDDLNKTFPSPAIVTIKSLTSSLGLLAVNPNYDGKTDTFLVKNGSLPGRQTDTLHLILNIDLNGTPDSLFYNVAVVGSTDLKGNFQPLDTSATVQLKILPSAIFIPDGFSPNGDGFNDKYVIPHKPSETVDLVVYNRWGNIVFKEENYQNGWDGHGVGSFLGKELEEGIYYVLVTVTSRTSGSQQKFVKPIVLRRAY